MKTIRHSAHGMFRRLEKSIQFPEVLHRDYRDSYCKRARLYHASEAALFRERFLSSLQIGRLEFCTASYIPHCCGSESRLKECLSDKLLSLGSFTDRIS